MPFSVLNLRVPWFRSFRRLAARSGTRSVNLLKVSEPSACDSFCFRFLQSLAALARLSRTAIFLSSERLFPNLSGASVSLFGIALSLLLDSDCSLIFSGVSISLAKCSLSNRYNLSLTKEK